MKPTALFYVVEHARNTMNGDRKFQNLNHLYHQGDDNNSLSFYQIDISWHSKGA